MLLCEVDEGNVFWKSTWHLKVGQILIIIFYLECLTTRFLPP